MYADDSIRAVATTNQKRIFAGNKSDLNKNAPSKSGASMVYADITLKSSIYNALAI